MAFATNSICRTLASTGDQYLCNEQQIGAEGLTVALYLLWKSMSPRR